MNRKQESYRNIEMRLSELKEGYRKLESSSYPGYMYELEDAGSNRHFAVDLRIKEDEDFTGFIFEMYPEILICDPAYLAGVSAYCQSISVRFGNVFVDKAHRTITFHAETFCVERPISQESLKAMEREGMRVLTTHFSVLQALACGKMAHLQGPDPAESAPLPGELYDRETARDQVRDYLEKYSHHNAICEGITSDSSDFSCQILTDDTVLRLKLHFLDEGMLSLHYSFGQSAMIVPDKARYLVADYLDGFNSSRMFGQLRMGDEKEGFHCSFSTSLLDGAIGKAVFDLLESLAYRILNESVESVARLSAGMPLLRNDSEETSEDHPRRGHRKMPDLEDLFQRLQEMNHHDQVPDLDDWDFAVPDDIFTEGTEDDDAQDAG